MPTLAIKITDAGEAAIQAAAGTATVVISHLGLTADTFDYAPTLTALPGEFKRLDVASGQAAAANITHLTAYDTSGDVWSARGLGLFLSDGTLFAVYVGAAVFMTKAQLAFGLLALDIAFEADLAATIAYGNAVFAYPPATWKLTDIGKFNVQSAEGTGLRLSTGAVGRFIHASGDGGRALVVEDYQSGSGGQDTAWIGFSITWDDIQKVG